MSHTIASRITPSMMKLLGQDGPLTVLPQAGDRLPHTLGIDGFLGDVKKMHNVFNI